MLEEQDFFFFIENDARYPDQESILEKAHDK